MASLNELETLLKYVLSDRNRELLESEGLKALSEEKRTDALRALQNLGWVGTKGFRHHEDTYLITKEGRKVIEAEMPATSFDLNAKEHLDAIRASDSDDPQVKKAGLRRLIELECDLGNWDSVLVYCYSLRDQATGEKDLTTVAFTYFSQGRAERAQNQWSEALESYLKANELYMDAGDRKGVCSTNRSLGIVYGNKGDYQSALRCLETSVSLAKTIEDKEEEVKARGNLAIIYELLGRLEDAEEAGRSCLQYFVDTGDYTSAAKSALNLGVLSMSCDKLQSAAQYLEQSVKSGRQMGSKTILGTALVNAGYCYARMGSYEKALQYTKEAMEIFREPNDANMLALGYRNLGRIEFNRGSCENSRDYFEKSVRLAQECGVRETFAACCYEFGMALLKSATNLTLARKLLKKSASVYSDLGNSQRAQEISRSAAAA